MPNSSPRHACAVRLALERGAVLRNPRQREGYFCRQRGCEASLGCFRAVSVAEADFPLARRPLRIYSRSLAGRKTVPGSPASTGAVAPFLISGSRDAVGTLFPRGLLGFEVGEGPSARGGAEPHGRPCAGSPRAPPRCSQNAGPRRPQAPPAPAEAPAAEGDPLELPPAARRCWREAAGGCVGWVRVRGGRGGLWVLSPLGRCARGARRAAQSPGRACAVRRQKVKRKTIIGGFHFPLESLAFQVALMACE